jgi:hypothetical protein
MKDPVETIQKGFVILLHAVGAGHIEELYHQGATFLYRRIADANDRLQLFNRLPERSLIEKLIERANDGETGWITVNTVTHPGDTRGWRMAVLAQPQASIHKMYLEMVECEGCEDELSLQPIPVRKYPAAA